jgi:succinate dehydrogenase / fumarate reductase iron-sulfur subunit
MSDSRVIEIFRYDPDTDTRPHMQAFEVDIDPRDRMLLDVLVRLKSVDESISLWRSCREGICGSDAINSNGRNRLACQINMNDLPADCPAAIARLARDP